MIGSLRLALARIHQSDSPRIGHSFDLATRELLRALTKNLPVGRRFLRQARPMMALAAPLPWLGAYESRWLEIERAQPSSRVHAAYSSDESLSVPAVGRSDLASVAPRIVP